MREPTRIAILLVALVCCAGVAAADSIYLKNGRVIRTSVAVVEGDRVMFSQYGHAVSIPLSRVERVVQDDHEDPAPLPPSTAPVPGVPDPAPPAAGAGGRAGADTDPEQTEEYWQNRVRAIYAEREQLEVELRGLRRVERAFLFSHRSTADTRRRIEDVQSRLEANEQALPDMRREARRRGIPAGWLRVRGVTSAP